MLHDLGWLGSKHQLTNYIIQLTKNKRKNLLTENHFPKNQPHCTCIWRTCLQRSKNFIRTGSMGGMLLEKVVGGGVRCTVDAIIAGWNSLISVLSSQGQHSRIWSAEWRDTVWLSAALPCQRCGLSALHLRALPTEQADGLQQPQKIT